LNRDLVTEARVPQTYLAPIVAERVRENCAGRIERASSHGLIRILEHLESLLGILVPERVSAIGSTGREGAHRVEGNRIHRIDEGEWLAVITLSLFAMAFEREVLPEMTCHIR